jgi:hypothetical protein
MMDGFGLNAGFLLIQLFNLALICGWPLLSLGTVFALRQHKLTGTLQAVWVLIVVAVPFLGALAYWIVRPTSEN